ncbi:MAG: Hsp20/alpha crystallin family protein [Candidatus Cloacimonetes bacterium]|nr:Hsp20/alpha crystallin family protein [Candidatus Cloacimonadota bacterium]
MKRKVFLAICISVFAAYTITCANKDIKVDEKKDEQSIKLDTSKQSKSMDQVFKTFQDRLNFSPWSRFHDVESFFDRMNMFDGHFFNAYHSKKSSSIHETENEFIVEVELPGVKKEDIKVTLKNETLEIQGQKRSSYNKSKDQVTGTLRGAFYKKFSLPGGVVENQVKASYSDGLLVVKLTKSKDLASKEILIE